jgi:hypothetical protein
MVQIRSIDDPNKREEPEEATVESKGLVCIEICSSGLFLPDKTRLADDVGQDTTGNKTSGY